MEIHIPLYISFDVIQLSSEDISKIFEITAIICEEVNKIYTFEG